jgi:hypothetical protein
MYPVLLAEVFAISSNYTQTEIVGGRRILPNCEQ